MRQIADKIEISIHIPSGDFVKVISDNLAKTTIVMYPTKYIFMGKINDTSFKLYRLKRFSRFDYNATEFKGTIHNSGQTTKLTVDFSLIWIYKNNVPLTLMIFVLLDYFVVSADNATWLTTGSFLFVELLVLGQLWFQNKSRFKKDKQRYFEILKSLFGTMEIKNDY
jgi:hypothetical protein